MLPNLYTDVNGVRTRYRQADREGPPVIPIYGLGASAEICSANIDALPSRHRVSCEPKPTIPPGGFPVPACSSRALRPYAERGVPRGEFKRLVLEFLGGHQAAGER